MNDIEEFLRRAAAMRAQQAQQRGQPPQRKAPPRNVPQQAAPPVAPPVRYTPPAQVLDAEIIDAEPVSGDDVAAEVQRHLDTRRFQERTSHLAENIRAADEAIEARLHATFEHRLGQLGATTSAAEDSILDAEENAAKAAAKAASQINFRDLLRSPESIRNAIILTEVLQRPEHRW